MGYFFNRADHKTNCLSKVKDSLNLNFWIGSFKVKNF